MESQPLGYWADQRINDLPDFYRACNVNCRIQSAITPPRDDADIEHESGETERSSGLQKNKITSSHGWFCRGFRERHLPRNLARAISMRRFATAILNETGGGLSVRKLLAFFFGCNLGFLIFKKSRAPARF